MSKPWMTSEDRIVREMWGKHSMREIARVLGRNQSTVFHNAARMGLPKIKTLRLGEPPADEWVEIATQHALEAGLSPGEFLAGCKLRRASKARWRAWRAILDRDHRYSVAGVARVSGFDHTSVLHGLAQVAAGRA